MSLPVDKILVVLPTEDPSPVAFMNLYDPGDVWIKVQGCEACLPERAKKCCTNCPQSMEKGCEWHFEPGRYKSKPFHCCILPIPFKCMGGCALVFKCVSGRWKDFERHVSDTRGVLRDGDRKVSV